MEKKFMKQAPVVLSPVVAKKTTTTKKLPQNI